MTKTMQDRQTNQVFTTTNYNLFKSIDGNRNQNLMHINKLKKSMEQNYLFTSIIVNEKKQIIDGQHRFEVIKELGLPLNYMVCRGYGLHEVHILNQTSKTWNADDYLTGYCNLGYAEYMKYREFKDKYEIGHCECMALLNPGAQNKQSTIFYSGEFVCRDIKTATSIMEKIFSLSPYYKGYKRRSFIMAIANMIKNKKQFKFDEFLHKVKLQPTALVDCGTAEQYAELIENIYNYRSRDKVNLRF